MQVVLYHYSSDWDYGMYKSTSLPQVADEMKHPFTFHAQKW